MRLERGSVSIVAAGILAMVAVMALASADVARVLAASARAQTAADAAALAAAQELALPSGRDPTDEARDYAAWNGAALRSCTCSPGSLEAIVEVDVDVGSLLLLPGGRRVEARARAVVDLPGG